jgi:hypothetical protein
MYLQNYHLDSKLGYLFQTFVCEKKKRRTASRGFIETLNRSPVKMFDCLMVFNATFCVKKRRKTTESSFRLLIFTWTGTHKTYLDLSFH